MRGLKIGQFLRIWITATVNDDIDSIKRLKRSERSCMILFFFFFFVLHYFQGFTAEQDQPYTRTGFLSPPKAWRIVSYSIFVRLYKQNGIGKQISTFSIVPQKKLKWCNLSGNHSEVMTLEVEAEEKQMRTTAWRNTVNMLLWEHFVKPLKAFGITWFSFPKSDFEGIVHLCFEKYLNLKMRLIEI